MIYNTKIKRWNISSIYVYSSLHASKQAMERLLVVEETIQTKIKINKLYKNLRDK